MHKEVKMRLPLLRKKGDLLEENTTLARFLLLMT